jgi:hypothetical protein
VAGPVAAGGVFLRIGAWALAGVGLDRVVREWLRGGSSSSGGKGAEVVRGVGVGVVAAFAAGAIAGAAALNNSRRKGRRYL